MWVTLRTVVVVRRQVSAIAGRGCRRVGRGSGLKRAARHASDAWARLAVEVSDGGFDRNYHPVTRLPHLLRLLLLIMRCTG